MSTMGRYLYFVSWWYLIECAHRISIWYFVDVLDELRVQDYFKVHKNRYSKKGD